MTRKIMLFLAMALSSGCKKRGSDVQPPPLAYGQCTREVTSYSGSSAVVNTICEYMGSRWSCNDAYTITCLKLTPTPAEVP